MKAVIVREIEEGDVEEAAVVYARGLLREKPPGSNLPLNQLTKDVQGHLRRALAQREEGRRVWITLREGRICGVIDFLHRGRRIKIRFICADPPGEGVGTRLMRRLAMYGVKHGVKEICATVSPIDQRAMNFYFHHLPFQQVGTEPGPGFALLLASANPSELLSRVGRNSSDL